MGWYSRQCSTGLIIGLLINGIDLKAQEKNPHICSQLNFYKGTKIIPWQKEESSQQMMQR